MGRIKNHVIRCNSVEELERLKYDYEHYAGRDTIANARQLTLTVLALPRNYKRKAESSRKRRDSQDRYGGVLTREAH